MGKTPISTVRMAIEGKAGRRMGISRSQGVIRIKMEVSWRLGIWRGMVRHLRGLIYMLIRFMLKLGIDRGLRI